MRDIKFRVWDIIDEKYLNYDPTFEFNSLNEIFTDTRLIFEQYTGFQDADGKEIYEGDILLLKAYLWYLDKYDTGEGIEITINFDNVSNKYIATTRADIKRMFGDKEETLLPHTHDLSNLLIFNEKNIKIIGNIHEEVK